MNCINYTLDTPEENIALDELLLLECNQGQHSKGLIRFWESATPFVVMGLSKQVALDIYSEQCHSDGIPIIRRCSGGGTVLQGPGCLSYALIFPISFSPELEVLSQTNTFMLKALSEALSSLDATISPAGITDLAINNVKISGNAQRRLQRAILFHGTVLIDMDLNLVSKYLKHPPIQPSYRDQRSHKEFIQNTQFLRTDIQTAIMNYFSATLIDSLPIDKSVMQQLISEKYGNDDWNFRR
jgi:Lipoate-protein ligase A